MYRPGRLLTTVARAAPEQGLGNRTTETGNWEREPSEPPAAYVIVAAVEDRQLVITRRSGVCSSQPALAAAAERQRWRPGVGTDESTLPIGPEPIRYPSGVWKVHDERFRK